MRKTTEVLLRARECGLDLLDSEIVVYYLKRAVGDFDHAIVLSEE